MPGSCVVLSEHGDTNAGPAVRLAADLCRAFLDRALSIHAAGLKSYGVLTAEPGDPYTVADIVFLDPTRNRRNEPGNREAFHAQGAYFRQYDDAGFVADPTELLHLCRRIDQSGQQIVAVFHTHRRQPANFSIIDYRLHNPAFPWHLIVSLHDPRQPLLQPYAIGKPLDHFGITPADDLDRSEQPYPGPEVQPLPLLVSGSRSQLVKLAAALNPEAAWAADRNASTASSAPATAEARRRPRPPQSARTLTPHDPVHTAIDTAAVVVQQTNASACPASSSARAALGATAP